MYLESCDPRYDDAQRHARRSRNDVRPTAKEILVLPFIFKRGCGDTAHSSVTALSGSRNVLRARSDDRVSSR